MLILKHSLLLAVLFFGLMQCGSPKKKDNAPNEQAPHTKKFHEKKFLIFMHEGPQPEVSSVQESVRKIFSSETPEDIQVSYSSPYFTIKLDENLNFDTYTENSDIKQAYDIVEIPKKMTDKMVINLLYMRIKNESDYNLIWDLNGKIESSFREKYPDAVLLSFGQEVGVMYDVNGDGIKDALVTGLPSSNRFAALMSATPETLNMNDVLLMGKDYLSFKYDLPANTWIGLSDKKGGVTWNQIDGSYISWSESEKVIYVSCCEKDGSYFKAKGNVLAEIPEMGH